MIKDLALSQQFSTADWHSPLSLARRNLALSGDIFGCYNLEKAIGIRELRPGILLYINILYCTGNPYNQEFIDPKCQ